MKSLLDAIELCRKQAALQEHAWYIYLVGNVFLATAIKDSNQFYPASLCEFVCEIGF